MEATEIEIRRAEYALRRARHVGAALAALERAPDAPARVEALAAFVEHPKATARQVVGVIEQLRENESPIARRALERALTHRLIKVRCAAIGALGRAPERAPWQRIARRLRDDPSHKARSALVDLLSEAPEAWRWEIMNACDDPHWRPRSRLILALQRWSHERGLDETLSRARTELARRDLDSDRARGVLSYVALWGDPSLSVDACTPDAHGATSELDLSARAWWSEEPGLLRARLEALTREEALEEQSRLVWLLSHHDARIRSLVLDRLTHMIEVPGVVSFLIHCSEGRRHVIHATRARFMERVSHDTLEEAAWRLLDAYARSERFEHIANLPPLRYDGHGVCVWALEWLATSGIPRGELTGAPNWARRRALMLASKDPRELTCALSTLEPDELDAPTRARAREALDHPEDAVSLAAMRLLEDTLVAEDLDTLERSRRGVGWHVAFAELAWRLAPEGESWTELCAHPSIDVRACCAAAMAASGASSEQLDALARDPSAHVRARALTRERASALLDDPSSETSWEVLEAAGRMCSRRLESIVPIRWVSRPDLISLDVYQDDPGDEEDALIRRASGGWWDHRPLGSSGLKVSRMGVSGHYALPERGFAEALERGINAFFWEPIYLSQSRFFSGLSPQAKHDVVMCCGTFEASAKGLRRDLELALRSMGLERIGVFYVFWVRERERLSEELLREMERCRDAGLVHTFGVSTHSRALAREFIEEWPAVMVRHNAAHTGVEREVLPFVDPERAGITTFSNLCYGRMVAGVPGWDRGVPRASDAYRYSLTHDGVTSCWSAPSTLAQLRENLSALDRGPMTSDELEEMRAYGRLLYRMNSGFNRFVRSR